MKKYMKKPIPVEAIQYTEDTQEEILSLVCKYAGGKGHLYNTTSMEIPAINIPTLEGNLKLTVGNWLIIGVKGEPYPINNCIFRETYEEVKDENKMAP